jgi:hypothetical protein
MTSFSDVIGRDGALVTLQIGVSEVRRNLLQRFNFPVPPASEVQALLDTGSFFTLGDIQAIAPLGVKSYDTRKLLSAATGTTTHNRDVYDLSITILDPAGQPFAYWPSVDVIDAAFPSTDIVHGIVGRDLLSAMVFHFDGKSGLFSLTM